MKEVILTSSLKIEAQNAEDVEEFNNLATKLVASQESWKKKINEIIVENHYSNEDFGKKCGVSRTAVKKWRNGSVPQKRETYIRIGFAAHYNLEEMNDFLKRYGRCTGLYPKSLDDSIIIYVLSSEAIPHRYESYLQISNQIQAEMDFKKQNEDNVIDSTDALNMILDNKSEQELIEFINSNIDIFKTSFYQLYGYIETYIEINKKMGMMKSITELSYNQEWSSSLRACVTQIRNHKWYPKRDKIISLGLHLNMYQDQIDEMLQLAHMEPLCAKNIFESAVIFAVESAKLENKINCNGSTSLCAYVRKIFSALGLQEIEFFMDELPEW